MNEINNNNDIQETAAREVPRDLPELEDVDIQAALSIRTCLGSMAT